MGLNKILIMFFVGLLLVGFVSAVPPDNDGDGCVSLGEISGYVASWLQGSITLSQVSSGVSWWLDGCVAPSGGTIIANHNAANQFSNIPSCWIEKVKQDLHIGYSHTSHGNQISTGIVALRNYNSIYATSFTGGPGMLHFEDTGDGFGTGYCQDLSVCDDGGEGILLPTRTYLNSDRGQSINTIMWSWCAIGGHNIPFYLDKMQTLIMEYENGAAQHPTPVKFVFITGHSDSQGSGDYSSFADYTNRLIRSFIYNQSPNAFCQNHECIFYDFADIEEYDPDNNYFLDNYVGENLDYYPSGNWGTDYLARHPTGLNAELTNQVYQYGYCAHSDDIYGANLNCALKGKAVWWMFARMAGWDGISQTCD